MPRFLSRKGFDMDSVGTIVNLPDGVDPQDAATVAQLGAGGAPSGPAGGVLDGTYPNPGLAAGVAGAGLSETSDVLAVNVDGSTLEIATDALQVKALGITDAHVAAANKDGVAGTASMRTLGTGAQQAAAGNDSRLSDSRAPSGAAGGVLSGTYPNPGFAADMATQAELDAVAASAVLDGDTAGGDLNGTYPNPLVDDAIGGGKWTIITKAGDESVTGSTTLQDDNDLLFSTASGALYEIELILLMTASTTGDFKCALGETTAVNHGQSLGSGLGATGQTALTSIRHDQTGLIIAGTAGGSGATDARALLIKGTHVGQGGTLKLLWAQNTSDGAQATIVKAGSILRYRRLV